MTFLLVYPSVPLIVLAMCWCLYLQTYAPGKRADWIAAAVALPLAGNMAAQALVSAMSAWRPAKLDLYAHRLDGWMGQPAFVLGQLCERHFWLKASSSFAYGLAPVSMIAVFAATLYLRGERESLAVARTYAASWLILPFLYFALPVCGPRFAFASFPELPDALHSALHGVVIDAPPNGMPSGHFACALLFCWFLRYWCVGRIVGGVFLVLTFVATLGSGQHYLVDLIGSVPYTWGVVWVGERLSSLRPHATGEALAGIPDRAGRVTPVRTHSERA